MMIQVKNDHSDILIPSSLCQDEVMSTCLRGDIYAVCGGNIYIYMQYEDIILEQKRYPV